jgi:hypothetical protein
MESDIPLWPIGKYKNKQLTEVMIDRGYIEWCKAQPGLLDKYPIIKNIIINQTVISGKECSKTPEHNLMQNMFLKKEYQQTFASHVLSYITPSWLNDKLTQLYNIPSYKEYFGDKRIDISNLTFSSSKTNVEFEGIFNWDVILTCSISTDEIKGKYEYNIWDKIVIRDFDLLTVGEGGVYPERNSFIRLQNTWNIYIEIKPIIGDDYPSVLRKMKTQIELTKQKTRHRSFIPVLFVDEFNSSTTTLTELRDIFAQSGIKIVLKNDIMYSSKKYISITEEEYLYLKKCEESYIKLKDDKK